MFVTDKKIVRANKEHRCTWCSQKILSGETYSTWKSVDDSWFTSKMHHECESAMRESFDGWDDTYDPYDNERPMEYK